jgi:hypothetical protein
MGGISEYHDHTVNHLDMRAKMDLEHGFCVTQKNHAEGCVKRRLYYRLYLLHISRLYNCAGLTISSF